AAAEGNYRLCQALLGLDARIEATDKNKATPLLLAVERNRPTVVSLLLRYGANPRVRDYAGWTLLHHAAHNNATDILEQLLYTADLAAPDVDATCPAKKTALHHCADLTLYDSAKVLLQHGADPNKLDIANRTPLWFAVSK
ncbi:ankyrin repeat-containing domain protein, partial [Lineolata rhizophorae]